MIKFLTTQETITNGRLFVTQKKINGHFETHYHEFYEMEIIVSGKGTYTIDGKNYDIKPGMLFFLTPLNFHCLNVENTVLYNIMFKENMCDFNYLSKTIHDDFPVAIQIENDNMKFLESLLEEIIKNISDLKYSSLILNNILAKIIKITVKENKIDLTPILMAELYIMNNFRSNITLNDIAEYIGYSAPYFSAYFKQKKGITFKKYVNNLRFKFACNLLEFSNLTITEICGESGFVEYTNFIRRFKQRYGVSPQKYRNNLQGRFIKA